MKIFEKKKNKKFYFHTFALFGKTVGEKNSFLWWTQFWNDLYTREVNLKENINDMEAASDCIKINQTFF